MADLDPGELRRLSAELRQEVDRIDRITVAIEDAVRALSGGTPSTLEVFGSAAVLDSFYTGVEKAFGRIAQRFGGLPEGPAWHRTLLEDMSLAIPKLRPAVVSTEAQCALGDFLSFRHRFRNLYVFDLRADLIADLLGRAQATWALARAGLIAFCGTLDALADRAGS